MPQVRKQDDPPMTTPCQPNQFNIIVKTPSYQKETLLTDDKYLSPIGKSVKDVSSAQWDTNYYPECTYVERNVASRNHPLQGSGSAKYQFDDGSQETFSLIVYQDYNPKGSHFGGKEHWNFELRAENLPKTLTTIIPFHQVPQSSYIHIEIIDCSKNATIFAKRLNWITP